MVATHYTECMHSMSQQQNSKVLDHRIASNRKKTDKLYTHKLGEQNIAAKTLKLRLLVFIDE